MSASLMVLGRLVENCVSIAIVLNYGTQCQLLIYYLKDITLRLEEKTADLNLVMKVKHPSVPSAVIFPYEISGKSLEVLANVPPKYGFDQQG